MKKSNLFALLGLAFIALMATGAILTEQQVFRGDVYFDHVNWYINGTKMALSAAQLNACTVTTSGVTFSNDVLNDCIVTASVFATTGTIYGNTLIITGSTTLATATISGPVTMSGAVRLGAVTNPLVFPVTATRPGASTNNWWIISNAPDGALTSRTDFIRVQIGTSNYCIPAMYCPPLAP